MCAMQPAEQHPPLECYRHVRHASIQNGGVDSATVSGCFLLQEVIEEHLKGVDKLPRRKEWQQAFSHLLAVTAAASQDTFWFMVGRALPNGLPLLPLPLLPLPLPFPVPPTQLPLVLLMLRRSACWLDATPDGHSQKPSSLLPPPGLDLAGRRALPLRRTPTRRKPWRALPRRWRASGPRCGRRATKRWG